MRYTKIRASLMAAAILLYVSASGGQAPSGFDFQPLEKVAEDELRETGTPGGAVAVVLGDWVIFSPGARRQLDLPASDN